MVLVSSLSGCGTDHIRNEALSPAVNDKVNDAFDEKVELLEKGGSGPEKILGYATPGLPLRLPGKVIRVYVTPMKSPMGRLIGEHYVWAIVQEESWWTPAETGLDTIVPSDVYRKYISDERKK